MNANELASFVGFTSDDVKKLSEKYDFDYAECKRWYDGYMQNGYEIYNPESVVKAITKKEFCGYWSKTSTYDAISDRIRQNFKGVKEDVISMLSGEEVEVDIDMFMNTLTDFRGKG